MVLLHFFYTSSCSNSESKYYEERNAPGMNCLIEFSAGDALVRVLVGLSSESVEDLFAFCFAFEHITSAYN